MTHSGAITADEVVSKLRELSLNLDLVKQEIEAIETELKNFDKINHDLGAIQIEKAPVRPEEIVVGFKDEEMTIKNKLTGGSEGLGAILIYGRGGLGKTALAKKVYNDPLVLQTFDLRAWIDVSQEYQKRDLLIDLLRCVSDRANGTNQMTEEELGEQLYRRLKGRKYFIVMDDVWDGRAWDDLKERFPNDRESRILFTTRLKAVAVAQPASFSLPLPFLTPNESWELFRLKVFQGGTCPFELMEIGMQIAKKCGGLPLAIIMAAEILANEEKRKDRWEEVEKIINRWMVADPNLCLKVFKLSYEHSPSHLMEMLNALKSSGNYLSIIDEVKDLLATLYGKLGLLRTFFKEQEEGFYRNEKVKSPEIRIRDVENVVKKRIARFTSKRKMKWDGTMTYEVSELKELSLNLDLVKQEIEAIETELKNCDKIIHDLEAIQIENVPNAESLRVNASAWPEERVVGFKDEEMIIKEKLTRGPEQLQLILIYGMAGQGKTTLAKKVYNDPLVVHDFYLRAWITVSEEYRKTDLLRCLLSCAPDRANEINQMSEEKLGEQLRKRLKGMKYFIVMDDVWDSRAWDDLKECFPNDRNGSRILFTSRHEAVAFAQHVSLSLPLPSLTQEDSWELFQLKVFQGGTCPFELMEIGMQMAKKCRGLPLAIIMVAGILANEEKRKDRWEEVEKIVSQSMVADPNLCSKIFELSYKHLPPHLRPCFLYFGAFPEDFQIPVRKLIWLWIAEGFIQETIGKNLEDVAEEYLMNLTYRSLIMVSKRGYEGRPKTCNIHDLLRGFCLKKAEKENFLLRISDVQEVSLFSSCPRRLCIDSLERLTKIISDVQKVFLFSSSRRRRPRIDSLELLTKRLPSVLDPHSFLSTVPGNPAVSRPLAFLLQASKLLRVLEVSSILLDSYPTEIEQLGFLRYLALSLGVAWVPASIGNLCNLEVLVIVGFFKHPTLPMEKMGKLRHVLLDSKSIEGVEIFREGTVHTPLRESPESSLPLMDSLQTLLWVNPDHCLSILNEAPNLRKLGIRGKLVTANFLRLPQLTFLQHLQKLKLFNISNFGHPTYLRSYNFPRNLKKLSLRGTNLIWGEISRFGKLLPNLEVLKLLAGACLGSFWVTGEVEFPKLKFLKFEHLDIQRWDCCSDHFPCLQRVELVLCASLKQIPSEIGYIPTLQMIEVRRCNRCVADSAREIKQEQESMGNNYLQISLEPSFSSFDMQWSTWAPILAFID